MRIYSISEDDKTRECLVSLYPLMREKDSKQFYGVFQREEKIWLVIDKLSFCVIETVEDDCGDIYDRSEDDSVTTNRRPEEGFVYVTDTSEDYMRHHEPYLSLETVCEKILSVVKAFEPDVCSDDVYTDYALTDGVADTKAEFYRYENYVMRHFKSCYFDKTVEITDGWTEWKYVKVSDIKVDYERCPISPVLMFSGERIAVRTKGSSAASDSFLQLTYDVPKNSWDAVGLLDEIMLKYGWKTSGYDGVRILDDTSEISDMLRRTTADVIGDILESCSFVKNT